MQAIVTLSQHRYEKDPELTVNKHQCPETRRSLANYINKAKITLFVCLSVFMCGDSEAAARLKQLELESSPLLAVPRNNMNVNVAMNNQASVCYFL